MNTGAIELGKVLTPESRLLHVVPGGQEAGENRVQWNWARCLPQRAASSIMCPADKERVETGAMELGKVLTP
jgi:hypothetical protein